MKNEYLKLGTCILARGESLEFPECNKRSTTSMDTDIFIVIHVAVLWESWNSDLIAPEGDAAETSISSSGAPNTFPREGTTCGVSEKLDSAHSVIISYSRFDIEAFRTSICKLDDLNPRYSKK